MTDAVVVSHLCKKYANAEKNAVDDISFTIHQGEFFAFLGPNGAGKTTTIAILATTLAKTSGTVSIAGFDLDANPSLVRQHIGIIFQNPSLDLNLTAEENIRFHASLYGLFPFRPSYSLMPDSYKKKVSELASITGLTQDIFKPTKTYSGGMKRKLEIVRSFLHNPQVLFLDEPTTGLDPISRKNVWDYLKAIAKEKKITILLTTHYLEEADHATTACIISKGKIIKSGSPKTLKEQMTGEKLVIDSQNRTSLTSELTAKKIPYTIADHVEITVKNQSMPQIIKQIDTPLSKIKIHAPTLEEAYVAIINTYE